MSHWPNPTDGLSHSGYSEQATLPRLTVVLPTSNSPVSNTFPNTQYITAQRSSPVSYALPYCPPGQQQQQQQQQLFFPSYQARYHSGQTLSGSYNRASSCSSSADPWQPLPYDPSHTNLRISSDLSSPHSVYSPVSSLPQCRSPASPAYPARNSPSLDRTIPSSRGTMQLPYARTSPSLFPYDVQPEPKTKKRRKRLDPRQLEALSEMYTRTEYPSTEQRQRLADDLNLPSRRVQVWFQNKRQKNRQDVRNTANLSMSQFTVALSPDTPPIVAHSYGSPAPVSQMGEPLYLSRSP